MESQINQKLSEKEVILIIGNTQTGKSSFIRNLTKKIEILIGNGVESCTKKN